MTTIKITPVSNAATRGKDGELLSSGDAVSLEIVVIDGQDQND